MKYWILNRLKERSTWLGLTALATIVGVNLTEEQKNLIIEGGLIISSLIMTFTADRTP